MKRLLAVLAVLGLYSCGGGDSSGGGGSAGADAGCYAVTAIGVTFEWPGGVGPHVVNRFANGECDPPPVELQRIFVVADGEPQAVARCGTDIAEEVVTAPPVKGAASFFRCLNEVDKSARSRVRGGG